MTNTVGTAGNDVLTGTSGNDSFDLSQGGNDTASGQGGDDIFTLGGALTAADQIDGGSGTDMLLLDGDYSTGLVFGPTTLTNVESVVLAAGHDYALTLNAASIAPYFTLTLDGSALGASNRLNIDASNLTTTPGVLVLKGGAGDDTVTGAKLQENVDLGAGNDQFVDAGTYAGTIAGGTGSDKFVFDRSSSSLNSAITFHAGSSTVSLFDTASITDFETVTIVTGSSNDTATFDQPVHDSVWGGSSWDAGGGLDRATVDLSTDANGIRADYSAGVYHIQRYSGGAWGMALTLANVETLAITGGSGDDRFTGFVSSYAGSSIDGGGGTNTIDLSSDASGFTADLSGQHISGLATGIETILNIQHVIGGSGNDIFAGTAANEVFDGGGGTNTADYRSDTTGVTVNLLTGTATGAGVGTDTLISIQKAMGGSGNDTMTGGASASTFYASGGDDVFVAGAGTTTVDYSTSSGITANLQTGVVTKAGGGTDTLVNIHSIAGSVQADTFYGSTGNDTIVADTNDIINMGANLTPDDVINAPNATLNLDGDYSAGLQFKPTTISRLSSINLASGHSYKLIFDDANVPSGSRLDVHAEGLAAGNSAVIDASHVVSGGKVRLYGGAGNDNLQGGTGNDLLTGGDGNDIVDGGTGQNTLIGGIGDDYLYDSGSNSTLSGGDGDDHFSLTGTGATIDGGAGTDTVFWDMSANSTPRSVDFTSGSSAVQILGSGTVQNIEWLNLQSGSGNDTLTLHGLAFYDAFSFDRWDAGGGDDTATIDLSAGTANYRALFVQNYEVIDAAHPNADLAVISNAEHFNVTSGSGDDILIGYVNSDSLNGGQGNDTLTGGAGSDTLDGGAGNDTAKFSGNRSAYTVTANGGGYTIAGPDGTDSLTSIEMLSFDDQSITPANAVAPSGDQTISGTAGADILTGTSGNDTVTGGAGNDVINGGGGTDTLNGGADEDTITGGAGNDALDGGSSADTAVFAGTRSAYTITQTSTGNFTVSGPDGTDALTNIEYAKFDDQTMRLLPGTGTTVNFAADPSTYMGAIHDFDGNNLGGAGSWKLIGAADVNGDGRAEHILFNHQIGRWAEVGTEADGLTYFANNGWAGDTRVVGIYIDPLVANGTVVKNSDFDSQRRFQNDLQIDNIKSILGQGDYNHDGLQEIYFSLTDGTAYLHAYMHADGNIQYANYQNKQQVIDYLTSNGVSSSTWAGWFPSGQSMMAAVAG